MFGLNLFKRGHKQDAAHEHGGCCGGKAGCEGKDEAAKAAKMEHAHGGGGCCGGHGHDHDEAEESHTKPGKGSCGCG